ncbi:response regulator [bacterium]|nr:MAG: response regulator [bacterium]
MQDQAKSKVLVVDDDELSFFSIELAVRSKEFEVLPQAFGVADAIDSIVRNKPSIIIMDIRLGTDPVNYNGYDIHDGIELAKFINSKFEIPIVFATAYSDTETIARSIDTNFYGILTKPIEKTSIQTALLSALLRFQETRESKRQENLLNLFFEHSGLGYFMAALADFNPKKVKNRSYFLEETKVIKINQTLTNILRIPSGKLIGKPASVLLNSQEYDHSALIDGLISNGYYEGQIELQSDSDSKVYCEIYCKHIPSNSNDFTFIGTLRDITHHVESQFQLQMLAKAITEINEAVIVTTGELEAPNPLIVYVNEAACKMTGYDKQELLGKTPRILQGEKTDRVLLEQLKNELSSNKAFSGRTINYKKDGTPYYVEWNIESIFVEEQNKSYYVSIQRDITKEMKLLEELRKNQELLMASLNNSKVAKIILDSRSNVLLINDYASQLVKDYFGESNLQHKNLFEFLPKAQSKSLTKMLKRCDTEEFITDEVEFKNHNNRIFFEYTIRKIGHKLKLNEGQYLITGIDITQVKQAANQMLEVNKNLERMVEERTHEYRIAKDEALESAKVKERFLANMSHEIRTPINGIRGMIHLLQDTMLNQTQKDYLETIKVSSDNLLVIINDILDIEKIESGKIELEHSPFSISEVMKNITRVLHHKIEQKNIELNCHLSGLLNDYFVGDTARIQQILLNLVDNAVKFTPKGKVEIILESKPASRPDNQIISIDVTDSGIGMSELQLGKIFNPFEQADASINRRFGGTGLGLSITKRLIELMNGTIEVSSFVNKGTVFHIEIELPVWNNTLSPKTDQKKKLFQSDFSDVHILIVDDNKVNLLFLQRLLEKWHCIVDSADNGLTAIDLVRNKKYDLIFMDIQMPEMDGYEVSRFIRDELHQQVDELPIYAITADVLTDASDKMRQSGIIGMVTKPFEPEEIESVLETIQKQKLSKNAIAEIENPTELSFNYLDISSLNQMAGSDSDFRNQVLTQFQSVVEDTIQQFMKTETRHNPNLVRQLAHRLKPNAVYFQRNDIVELCVAILHDVKEQNKVTLHTWEQVLNLIQLLKPIFDELQSFAVNSAEA